MSHPVSEKVGHIHHTNTHMQLKNSKTTVLLSSNPTFKKQNWDLQGFPLSNEAVLNNAHNLCS